MTLSAGTRLWAIVATDHALTVTDSTGSRRLDVGGRLRSTRAGGFVAGSGEATACYVGLNDFASAETFAEGVNVCRNRIAALEPLIGLRRANFRDNSATAYYAVNPIPGGYGVHRYARGVVGAHGERPAVIFGPGGTGEENSDSLTQDEAGDRLVIHMSPPPGVLAKRGAPEYYQSAVLDLLEGCTTAADLVRVTAAAFAACALACDSMSTGCSIGLVFTEPDTGARRRWRFRVPDAAAFASAEDDLVMAARVAPADDTEADRVARWWLQQPGVVPLTETQTGVRFR